MSIDTEIRIWLAIAYLAELIGLRRVAVDACARVFVLRKLQAALYRYRRDHRRRHYQQSTE